MPTIDQLNWQLKLEQVTADNYTRLASEFVNDEALTKTLNKLRVKSDENIITLENAIQHQLEKEVW